MSVHLSNAEQVYTSNGPVKGHSREDNPLKGHKYIGRKYHKCM